MAVWAAAGVVPERASARGPTPEGVPMPATATRPDAPKSATAVMITPHLVCRDAASAIEFYQRALGAQEMRVIRAPGGGVMHAAMTLGENGSGMFFLADECPEFGNRSPLGLGGTPVTMHVHVKD